MKVRKSQDSHFGLTFLATGNETDRKYFLSEPLIPSGYSGPPLYAHSKVDKGFYQSGDKLTEILNDCIGGFTKVLAGLKSYLEHGINLNLIADKSPEQVKED